MYGVILGSGVVLILEALIVYFSKLHNVNVLGDLFLSPRVYDLSMRIQKI